MRQIRTISHGKPLDFPASDQHPAAVRYGPIVHNGVTLFIDAIGGEPTADEIEAAVNPPPPPERTPQQKLAAAGLTVEELRTLLA